MRKITTYLMLAVAFVLLLTLTKLEQARQELQENVIRLHVIASSDSDSDQKLKLKVKDRIVAFLTPKMEHCASRQEAQNILQALLPEIEQTANAVLQKENSTSTAQVMLTQEPYDTRHYDTFSLPAGVYQSLQIRIGAAEGKNWWCVVFPTLCMPSDSSTVEDRAVMAGIGQDTTKALTGNEDYEVRFFLLDLLGNLENFFFKHKN